MLRLKTFNRPIKFLKIRVGAAMGKPEKEQEREILGEIN
jgi:hypothetical protein